MKFFKKTFSIMVAVLMTLSILPISVSAATLKIITQPKTSYTAYNSTAKATVKATGDGLKYTWYYKNSGASKFTKASVTKATYSIKMTDNVKNRQVYCVVKDKKGKSVKSNTATLRMKATITTNTKTAYAQSGKTITISLKAKGDGLKYTWYKKDAGKTKFSKGTITKSSYAVTMNDSAKDRQIYCVVKDKYGITATSNKVYLRMAATIITQPKNATAKNGKTVSVTVKAKGDGLKYTWYKKDSGKSSFTKGTITKPTYAVTMNSSVNGRQIYCVVTDKYNKTAKTNTVSLKLETTSPLTITKQPENTIANIGDEVGFGIVVDG